MEFVTAGFRYRYARVRAHASWGPTPAEMIPSSALSCSYPRTPGLRPGPGRAAAMELASPFSGLNGHAARLTLPRASATSRPILSAKRYEVVLPKVLLTARGFATISSVLAGNRPIAFAAHAVRRPSA